MSEIIFEWEQSVDKMYIIKSGRVTLQRKHSRSPNYEKEMVARLKSTNIEELSKHPLLAKCLQVERRYDEIATIENGQSFGEEFVVNQTKTGYRAVAASEYVDCFEITGESIRKRVFSTAGQFKDSKWLLRSIRVLGSGKGSQYPLHPFQS